MTIISSILIYIALCDIIYIIMSRLYHTNIARALPNVRQKWLYYVLQFTWGLNMNIVGGIVALCLLICGRRPVRYGWNYCFELNINWGMELGIFFVAPKNASEYLKNHEHGHGIQNIYLGPFSIGVVSIPSAIRFWFRELMTKIGHAPTTDYDDIWFEG